MEPAAYYPGYRLFAFLGTCGISFGLFGFCEQAFAYVKTSEIQAMYDSVRVKS